MTSPLYDDEVQQHEMRYLDRLALGGKNRSPERSDDRGASQAGRALNGINGELNNGVELGRNDFGSPVFVYEEGRSDSSGSRNSSRLNCSLIASILSPYKRKNDMLKCGNDDVDLRGYDNVGFLDPRIPEDRIDDTNNQNSVLSSLAHNVSSGTGDGNERRNKPWNSQSNFIKSTKPCQLPHSKRKSHSKSKIPSAPSHNKRRQASHNSFRKVQSASYRLVKRMVEMGKSRTKQMSSLSKNLRYAVRKAAKNIHSLIEDGGSKRRRGAGKKTQPDNGGDACRLGNNEEGKRGSEDDNSKRAGNVAWTGPVIRSTRKVADNTRCRAFNNVNSSVSTLCSSISSRYRTPLSFSSMSSWIVYTTDDISQSAIALAQNSVRARSFISERN